MTLAQRITERADAYVRKPSLAPTYQGMPDGPSVARRADFLRRECARLALSAPRSGQYAETRGHARQTFGTLRTLAAVELQSTTDPED